MKNQHYGTLNIPRDEVEPGTLVKYRDRIYTASANVEKGLYIESLSEKTMIRSDEVTVFLNFRGKPLIH